MRKILEVFKLGFQHAIRSFKFSVDLNLKRILFLQHQHETEKTVCTKPSCIFQHFVETPGLIVYKIHVLLWTERILF